MITDFLLWSGISLLIYAVYKWSTGDNDYFTKRGVSYDKPPSLLAMIYELTMKPKALAEFMLEAYRKNPGYKLMGTFEFGKKVIYLRDPETIKQMVIKDFDHFEDHRNFIDDSVDVLFGNSLFQLKGAKWRDMRATLSPAFTGAKMRQMFDLVSDCSEQMAQTLSKRSLASGKVDCEMKDVFSKYTNDVISSAAFGYKINSFEDPNNEFYLSGKKLDFSSAITMFRIMLILIVPKVAKLFNVSMFDGKVMRFFRSMVLDNMASREKLGIFRPDMINILMNVKKGNALSKATDEKADDGFATVEESSIGSKVVKRAWSDDELVAQCFLFFIAGFDTSSTLLSFMAYELCANPDIQQKLYEEIEETYRSLGGKKLTYDAVQNMKYLDMVVSETLRLWPPAPNTDRMCVKDYNHDDGQCKFTIEKGTVLLIPIIGLHLDEKYWDNPTKFNPERFSDDNKKNIIPGTYAPFGLGPRNCIGSRFALMEAKAIMYYLLLKFKLEPNADSQIPIKLKKSPTMMVGEKGIHLAMKVRA